RPATWIEQRVREVEGGGTKAVRRQNRRPDRDPAVCGGRDRDVHVRGGALRRVHCAAEELGLALAEAHDGPTRRLTAWVRFRLQAEHRVAQADHLLLDEGGRRRRRIEAVDRDVDLALP